MTVLVAQCRFEDMFPSDIDAKWHVIDIERMEYGSSHISLSWSSVVSLAVKHYEVYQYSMVTRTCSKYYCGSNQYLRISTPKPESCVVLRVKASFYDSSCGFSVAVILKPEWESDSTHDFLPSFDVDGECMKKLLEDWFERCNVVKGNRSLSGVFQRRNCNIPRQIGSMSSLKNNILIPSPSPDLNLSKLPFLATSRQTLLNKSFSSENSPLISRFETTMSANIRPSDFSICTPTSVGTDCSIISDMMPPSSPTDTDTESTSLSTSNLKAVELMNESAEVLLQMKSYLAECSQEYQHQHCSSKVSSITTNHSDWMMNKSMIMPSSSSSVSSFGHGSYFSKKGNVAHNNAISERILSCGVHSHPPMSGINGNKDIGSSYSSSDSNIVSSNVLLPTTMKEHSTDTTLMNTGTQSYDGSNAGSSMMAHMPRHFNSSFGCGFSDEFNNQRPHHHHQVQQPLDSIGDQHSLELLTRDLNVLFANPENHPERALPGYKPHNLKYATPFRCDVCMLYCTSTVQWVDHYKGKRHQIRVQAYLNRMTRQRLVIPQSIRTLLDSLPQTRAMLAEADKVAQMMNHEY